MLYYLLRKGVAWKLEEKLLNISSSIHEMTDFVNPYNMFTKLFMQSPILNMYNEQFVLLLSNMLACL